jgi:hypothetical protein
MSGSVFLNNLDDFILPSQACVNPLVASKLNSPMAGSSAKVVTTDLESNSYGVTINTTASKHSKKHNRITLETDYSTSDLGADYILSTSEQQPNLIKQKTFDSRVVASVSLNDCLACSGCVTSAEAILIQEQSTSKFVQLLEERNENSVIVVQISPNSRASIADFIGMSKEEFFLRIAAILKLNGVKYVLDSASAADVALIESREEFIHR